jgi:hypothetical protein
MKKVIYFPKEGDKKCISESYPIGEKGLAFNATIQKLEVLVSAGILRKIETDLIEFKEGETTLETKYTFEQWERMIDGENVEEKVAPAPVEETKETEVKEALEVSIESVSTEVENATEETKEVVVIASNDVVEAPVVEAKKKGGSKKVQQ